jgi:hypothetical protein
MGEGITDGSVWVKKSHWPMGIPGNALTIGNKYLICVRNPYDVIKSFFILNTHFVQGGEINEKVTDFPEAWNKYILECAQDIAGFYKYVIDHIVPSVPTLFIRFEDLRLQPQETLEKVFSFFLDLPSVEGLNI